MLRHMLKSSELSHGLAPKDEQLQVTVMRAQLGALIQRLTPGDGVFKAKYARLTLGNVPHVDHPIRMVYEPSLCVIAQGMKQVLLGEDVYVCDPQRYLVFSQNLPVTGHVLGATPETPHLAMRLDFDVKDIAALALKMDFPSKQGAPRSARGIFTEDLSVSLLGPLLRLLKLQETPEDIEHLVPLVVQEILYRLLKSADGWRLAQLAMADSHSHRVAQAISLVHKRFREHLRMEELANEVSWSVSALHHHFKSVTAISPLQYQKQLRLQEARRIMLSEHVDAATAGHQVGYESQSQFNREYSRFFGEPPVRDIKRLREIQANTVQVLSTEKTRMV